jgi:hypothetical protein
VHALRTLALFELLFALTSVCCKHPESAVQKPRVNAAVALAPRGTSRFVCRAGSCRQRHPRLPDSGEWRCADGGDVVWCAGGEAAAGVVSGAAEPRFRCGARWGNERRERVCIDAAAERPEGSENYQCGFEQELGIAKLCKVAAASPALVALPARAVPACWLGRDCPSGQCNRGACKCKTNSECQLGRCENELCVEGGP